MYSQYYFYAGVGLSKSPDAVGVFETPAARDDYLARRIVEVAGEYAVFTVPQEAAKQIEAGAAIFHDIDVGISAYLLKTETTEQAPVLFADGRRINFAVRAPAREQVVRIYVEEDRDVDIYVASANTGISTADLLKANGNIEKFSAYPATNGGTCRRVRLIAGLNYLYGENYDILFYGVGVNIAAAQISNFFDDQPRIILNSLKEDASNINYVKVINGTTGAVRYYYVDNNACIEPEDGGAPSYVLDLSLDRWQTFFFKEETGTTYKLPTLKKAVQTETTKNESTRAARVCPIKATCPAVSVLPAGQNAVLSVVYATDYVIPVVTLTIGGTLSQLLVNSAKMFSASQMKVGDNTYNLTPLKAYLTPSIIAINGTVPVGVRDGLLSTYLTAYMFNETQDRTKTTRPFTSGLPIVSKTKRYEVGTAFNRLPILWEGWETREQLATLLNDTAAGVSVRYTIGQGAFNIVLRVDGEELDITTDFELPVSYNAAAAYYTQHATSVAVKGFSTIAALAGSIATGNAVGAAGAAISAGGQVAQAAEAFAQPVGVRGSGDGMANFSLCRGLALWERAQTTEDSEQNAISALYGWKWRKYEETVDTTAFTFPSSSDETEHVRRKYEKIEVYGDMAKDDERYFEDTFKRGVIFERRSANE